MRQQLLDTTQLLATHLVKRKRIISLAESCTGGMLAELLTSIAGSSQWFDRAFITYSNDAKMEMLGVREATLIGQGAVSGACIEEMVIGALQASHAHLSVAISGIAGPSGGSDEKPVGTVWIAWVGHHIPLRKEKFIFKGDRDSIRQQACFAALTGMLACLNQQDESTA
jgi:nicotinamide-nucleotide amidase